VPRLRRRAAQGVQPGRRGAQGERLLPQRQPAGAEVRIGRRQGGAAKTESKTEGKTDSKTDSKKEAKKEQSSSGKTETKSA